jgi:hypothetical protein
MYETKPPKRLAGKSDRGNYTVQLTFEEKAKAVELTLLWREIYGEKISLHAAVSSAINQLYARLEAEKEAN